MNTQADLFTLVPYAKSFSIQRVDSLLHFSNMMCFINRKDTSQIVDVQKKSAGCKFNINLLKYIHP